MPDNIWIRLAESSPALVVLAAVIYWLMNRQERKMEQLAQAVTNNTSETTKALLTASERTHDAILENTRETSAALTDLARAIERSLNKG